MSPRNVLLFANGHWHGAAVIENRIKHRHLTSFVEVARQKSIGKAAAALAVSQPAVSKTIRELEAILGVELFDRSHRSVVLSSFGEVFLRYASASISALRQGMESVDLAARASWPLLRVGVSAIAMRHLPAAVARFGRLGPGLAVRLVTGDEETLREALAAGDVEFLLAGLPAPPALVGLVSEPLYRERLVLAVRAAHPLAGEEPEAAARRLGAFALLLPPPGASFHEAAERTLLRLGAVPLAGRIECASSEFGRRMTLASDGIWMTSYGEVADDLGRGGLAELAFDTADTAIFVALLRRADAEPTPAAALMMMAIREAVSPP